MRENCGKFLIFVAPEKPQKTYSYSSHKRDSTGALLLYAMLKLVVHNV